MSKTNGAFIVSWDFSNGRDNDILLIGERKGGRMTVLNAFQGKEARNIYEKLSGENKVKASDPMVDIHDDSGLFEED